MENCTIKSNKEKTIDMMIKLLEFARILPFFSINFKIKAKNNDIEKYLLEHVERYDWNGKHLPLEEIFDNYDVAISNFRSSEDYNANGKSNLKLRQVFTVQDINYNNIYKLVAGKLEDMPNNYEFVGEVELSSTI